MRPCMDSTTCPFVIQLLTCTALRLSSGEILGIECLCMGATERHDLMHCAAPMQGLNFLIEARGRPHCYNIGRPFLHMRLACGTLVSPSGWPAVEDVLLVQ